MELFNLGKVDWAESQLIYHALADQGREALCLVSPASPYVCIGYHQDVDQEIDLEFCQARSIPVFRRELGGGAVYLDGDQLFFQLILKRNNPKVPLHREVFFRKFLQPIINVYQRIGIPAVYKPVNDVLAGTRKISGTGVGEIGDCIVFVGNLIADFNYQMMSHILKVPDEKFRDRVHQTIEAGLSTIRRELGDGEAARWDEATLNKMMAEEFGAVVGELTPADWDEALRAGIEKRKKWMFSHEWLHRKGRRIKGREVKVRAGVRVIHRMHKAPGGLIRAVYELNEGRIKDLNFSGDFFVYPHDGLTRLEAALEGKTPAELDQAIEAFYRRGRIETPGLGPEDWLAVLPEE
ncbi:MAG: lipoate--protein ligase family protein [Deltaproteobacteria bacterium]|nr:lipoate--protein ligase family protein [Deltaproteobacteria bacterium]